MTFIEEAGFRINKSGFKYKIASYTCDVCHAVSVKSVKAHNRHKNAKCKSCGQTKHGDRHTRLYAIWANMKGRCNNKNNPAYERYGAVGIKICDEWNLDYVIFKRWAIDNGYSEKLTIERIKNNKGYNPKNCCWADRFTQAANRGINVKNKSGYIGVGYLAYRNIWYSEIGINYKTIRIGAFKTAEEAAMARNLYIVENKLPHTLNVINTKEEK